MKVNLLLATLLAVGILLLLVNPKPVQSQLPTTVHSCKSYSSNDTSTCGDGSSSSGPCSTSQVIHIGNEVGPGTTSYNVNFTMCDFGDGTSCNSQSVEYDTQFVDDYYCTCYAQHNPVC